MAKIKKLMDVYRFPGFVPEGRVHGIFGDPKAIVIPLQRLRKKRSAAFVDPHTAAITTRGLDGFAISRVATGGSISRFSYGAFSALGVGA